MNFGSVYWENQELCFYLPYFDCDKKERWHIKRAEYHLEQIERLCDINHPYCPTELRREFFSSI
jgi:hypothetical protein